MAINRHKVYEKYNGHCAYCGNEIKFKDMQVDHIHPKCQHRPIAKDIEGNYVYPDIDALENLNPSCRRCNHYKRGDTLQSFRVSMITLHERIAKNYINKVGIDYGIIELKPFSGKFYFEQTYPPQ